MGICECVIFGGGGITLIFSPANASQWFARDKHKGMCFSADSVRRGYLSPSRSVSVCRRQISSRGWSLLLTPLIPPAEEGSNVYTLPTDPVIWPTLRVARVSDWSGERRVRGEKPRRGEVGEEACSKRRQEKEIKHVIAGRSTLNQIESRPLAWSCCSTEVCKPREAPFNTGAVMYRKSL